MLNQAIFSSLFLAAMFGFAIRTARADENGADENRANEIAPRENRALVATHARIDVIADSDQVQLTDGRWLFGDDTFVNRINWLPDRKVESTYFGEFPVLTYAAPATVLTFVSNAECDLQVELKGPWRKADDNQPQRVFIDWSQFKVSSAQIVGQPFKPRTCWVDDPIR